jgi:hypothetical protein
MYPALCLLVKLFFPNQETKTPFRGVEVVSKPQIRFKGPAVIGGISDLLSSKLLSLRTAGRSRKRSSPHYLADEHFNPPGAEQCSCRIFDGVLNHL